MYYGVCKYTSLCYIQFTFSSYDEAKAWIAKTEDPDSWRVIKL